MPAREMGPSRAVLVTSGVLVAVCAAILVCTILLAFHARLMTVDDAFIVFRYAENLNAGLGFRWNAAGTPAEGFSSTTALFGIAGLIRAGVDPVVAALVLNLTGAVVMTAGLLAASGLRSWVAPITGLPLLYVLTDSNFVVHSSRGLETALFSAVAVLVILLAGRVVRADQPRTGGFMRLAMASLVLALSRPEAPLIVGASWLVAAIIVRRRGESIREMVPGLALLVIGALVYMAWRVWYFGAPLPTPYYVKANLPSWLGVREVTAFAAQYSLLLILSTVVSILCWIRLLRRDRTAATPPLEALVVLLVGPVWLLYAARILHEMGYGHRFSYPLVGIGALGLIAGLRFLLTTMGPKSKRVRSLAATAGVVAGLAVAVPHLYGASRQLMSPAQADDAVATFTAVGQAMGRLGLGDRITFVTPVAGAMPYHSRARHIDPFGLASHELSRRRPRSERLQFLNDLKWDVTTAVVPPASPGATTAASDPWFQTPYFTQFVVPAEEWVAMFDVLAAPEVGWLEFHHAEMRKLRDMATLVGRIPSPAAIDPPRTWRHFLYVSRASPHHDALVGTLRSVVVPGSWSDLKPQPR